ncbi:hypothetical protein Dimus_002987 [Dionaea muscipula]
MGLTRIRNLIRPIYTTLSARAVAVAATASISARATLSPSPATSFLSNFLSSGTCPTRLLRRSIHLESLSSLASKPFDALTGSRFPKRRPSDKSRRKRSSLRPPGPYAWVKYVPGQPILANQPNEGSMKLRNEKKRRRQRREFIKIQNLKRTQTVLEHLIVREKQTVKLDRIEGNSEKSTSPSSEISQIVPPASTLSLILSLKGVLVVIRTLSSFPCDNIS